MNQYLCLQSVDVIEKLARKVKYSGMELEKFAELADLAFGTVKNVRYQGVSPRYDHAVRLFAALVLTEELQTLDHKKKSDFLSYLTEQSVGVVFEAATGVLASWREIPASRRGKLPSIRRLKYGIKQRSFNLDFVVRFIEAGIISPKDLVEPLYTTSASLLPDAITHEHLESLTCQLVDFFGTK